MTLSKTALLKALASHLPRTQHHFAQDLLSELSPSDLATLTRDEWIDFIKRHYAYHRAGDGSAIHVRFIPRHANSDNAHTDLDVVVPDYAFVVDSIISLLVEHELTLDHVLYPRVERPGAKNKTIHLFIRMKGLFPQKRLNDLANTITTVQRDVERANKDWPALRARVMACKSEWAKIPPLSTAATDREENSAFLDYLHDGNFTFLGALDFEYTGSSGKTALRAKPESGLGLLSGSEARIYADDLPSALSPARADLLRRTEPFTFSKSATPSTVHRRVSMDMITLKRYDSKGRIIGETLLMGLLTSVTYSRSLRGLPYLRLKANKVIDLSGFDRDDHQGRALRHILEKYPRDEFLQSDLKPLLDNCLSILKLQECPQIALYMRDDPFGRFVSAMVYVPRAFYDTRLRLQCQSILERALDGHVRNFFSTVDDSALVRLHYIIAPKGPGPRSYTRAAIEDALRRAGEPWIETLRNAMHKARYSVDDISHLTDRYGRAFSSDYQSRHLVTEAIDDMRMLERLHRDPTLRVRLAPHNGHFSFKIYSANHPVPLSDAMRFFEPMGLRVLAEYPYELIMGDGTTRLWIQDFHLQLTESQSAALRTSADCERFERTFLSLIDGRAENDALNGLVLTTGFNDRDISLVRAYARYMRHLDLPYTPATIDQTMIEHPTLVVQLIDLFRLDHDPHRARSAAARKKQVDSIQSALDAIAPIDQDRIMRALLSCIDATLRTNFFSNGPAIALKINSSLIADLPKPVPYREIFIYGSRMEGIHLRSGPVARGGIRWSDRLDDYRIEILDLMKAQKVKNVVIVPTGAKGGFVVKKGAGLNPAEFRAEGIECYKIFIRSLLDITDNRVQGSVRHPAGIVCRDGDDPYLVVAADKGTATFSDTANTLSVEYGFWLDDAFASGGSAGYDHKKMGITARGAWESVKRHFLEMGVDTQTDPFEVIGVGDMSGDVFGNGMLLSRSMRLIGAFNHSHIIVDPDPDVALAFAERERLFKAALNWDQYDRKKLSKGGMIIARSEKTVRLTPEIKQRLGLTRDSLAPHDLIHALLQAPCDLLYFGGIGTYVKASSESHSDVKDKSNDLVRIDAQDLKARVIGEGANLAMTQSARIEAALSGIRLNTDFIDNSAGVDTSDHEVNLKILLRHIMDSAPKTMTRAARDRLLKSMTDDVAALVLRDNYEQTLAISFIERNAPAYVPVHRALIRYLEEATGLNRKRDGLPADHEFDNRMRQGLGLQRPEIALMLAHTKIAFRAELSGHPYLRDPAHRTALIGYFPKALTRYSDAIDHHPLRDDIVATILTNRIINRLGPGRVRDLQAKRNGKAAHIAKAYQAVARLFALDRLYAAMEDPAHALTPLQHMSLMSEINIYIDHPLTLALEDPASFDRETDLVRRFDRFLTETQKKDVAQDIDRRVQNGYPETIARLIARLRYARYCPDILASMGSPKTDEAMAAIVYFSLLERLDLAWLLEALQSVHLKKAETHDVLSGLYEQVLSHVRIQTAHLLTRQGSKKTKRASPADLINDWGAQREHALGFYDTVMADVKTGTEGPFDPLSLLRILQGLDRLQ